MSSFTEDDLKFYIDNEKLLKDFQVDIKKNQKSINTIKCHNEIHSNSKVYIGLHNLGATCYLNSLLQCFYANKSFVESIHLLHHNDLNHPSSISPSRILNELQKLFARLLLSNRSSVTTEPLLLSFGWNKSQLYEQHDVHEFFSIFLDSLKNELVNMNNKNLISDLFEGKMNDILQCPSCKYKSIRSSPFINISIDIQDSHVTEEHLADNNNQSKASSCHINELIATHLLHEVLDDDNKWNCTQCHSAVSALKNVEYQCLPKILFIHLKRFRFDPISRRRKKLSTPVFFNQTLPIHLLLPTYQQCQPLPDTVAASMIDNVIQPQVKDNLSECYELTGIILHSGTAMGGHYHSYLLVDHVWYDFNDDHVNILSTTDIDRMFKKDTDDLIATNQHHHNTLDNNNMLVSSTSSSYVHENAYMLMYRFKSNTIDDPDKATGDYLKSKISPVISNEIVEENKQYTVLSRLLQIKQQVLTLTVYLPPVKMNKTHIYTELTIPSYSCTKDRDPFSVTVLLLDSFPLSRAMEMIYEEFINSNKLDPTKFHIKNCRLRKCIATFASNIDGQELLKISLGQSFSISDYTVPLKDLTLNSPVASCILDIREESDPPFIEYHVDDMLIKIKLWSTDTSSSHDGLISILDSPDEQLVVVRVPGRHEATVGDLRSAVALALNTNYSQIYMILNDPYRPVTLLQPECDGDNLMQTHHIFSGSIVIVEILTTEITSDKNIESLAYKYFYNKRTRAILYYNFISATKPIMSDNREVSTLSVNSSADELGVPVPYIPEASSFTEEAVVRYDQSIEVSLDQSLYEVKCVIAQQLQINDINSFYCKRNSTGTQLKDESKTLQELSLTDKSILHLQFGSRCNLGDYLINFELFIPDTGTNKTGSTGINKYFSVQQLPVSEKSSIFQVKQLLFTKWKEIIDGSNQVTDNIVTPKSVACIRLRDGKAGKVSSILRDDRIISRCLLGLADGRRVVIEVLPNEEYIGMDDIIISLRIASYQKKCLYPSIDLPIARSSSIPILFKRIVDIIHGNETYQKILQLQENEEIVKKDDCNNNKIGSDLISIAKGYSTGPPLTFKTIVKLKWDDPIILQYINHTISSSSSSSSIKITPSSDINISKESNEKSIHREEIRDNDGVNLIDVNHQMNSLPSLPLQQAMVSTIDKLPLNLRDGSVIVVRSKLDYHIYSNFSSSSIQEQSQEIDNRSKQHISNGPGISAVRSKQKQRKKIDTDISIVSNGNNLISSPPSNVNHHIQSTIKEKSLKITSTTNNTVGVNSNGNISHLATTSPVLEIVDTDRHIVSNHHLPLIPIITSPLCNKQQSFPPVVQTDQ